MTEPLVKQGFTLANSLVLGMLTFGYIIGEISRYLIGTVSREMAQEIHFGDMQCYEMDDVDPSNMTTTSCGDIENEFE